MADDEKNFTFQFVPNKAFPGFESSDVRERFIPPDMAFWEKKYIMRSTVNLTLQ